MEREYEYLLHLLGAHLREEEPDCPAELDWTKLVQLAQIHCVTGILGYMTMTYPICPDEALRGSLRSVCLNTLTLFAHRAALAGDFSRTLSRNGIDHILMKGYILREHYPVPELRTFGDIDLVIRPEDRDKCHELMLSLGFHVEADWEPVFSYTKDREFYEIHSEIMEIDVTGKGNFRAYFHGMWDHASPAGSHRYHFTPEFHFLYILTHIAKHIHGSGAGARMYLDVAAFILRRKEDVDWTLILKELEKLGLSDFANVVFQAVENWFHVPAPVPTRAVPEDIMAEFTAFTMEAGVFGHFAREGAMSTLKNAERKGETSRFQVLLQRAFPDAGTIQSRYTYLQKHPWLLPAAWLHRLVKTRGSLSKHTHEAQVILSADAAEVQRLKRITRNIGL